MWKLIASDIDGTLVKDGSGVLEPAYYREIHRLAEKGIRFLACSGRQWYSMESLFHPVSDEIIFACEGGGLVFEKDKLLTARTIPPETAKAVIEDAMKVEGVDVLVAGTKRSYCRSRDSEMYRWLYESYGFDIEAVGNLLAVQDDIVKVSLYHGTKAEELTAPWFRPKWEKDLKLTLAGVQWLDCVDRRAGKGTALSFVQEMLGVSPEETMVFGDNQNDMEMFALAGKSYAVENAREEVKRAADGVCGSYWKNGVLRILQTL